MKSNLVLKVNGFFVSHIYLSYHNVSTNFIRDIEFTTDKNLAKNFTFNEAYEIISILEKHFKDIEIDEVNDEI